MLILFKKRVENLLKFDVFSESFIVRVNKCCSNIITNPIPNSTADKTSKKKVKDKIFVLS